MSERKNEAAWIESRSRWQINVQDNGVRKTFTSALAGRRGKADAERKAEKWLKDHTTSEKTRVDVFLDQYTDYLKETKSKSTLHSTVVLSASTSSPSSACSA